MKKKRILQAVSILLALLCLTACQKEDNQISGQELIMPTTQQGALEANEILMEHIDKYSKYYSGVYIDRNILHIQITTSSKRVIRKIESLLSEYKNCISIDTVDYSYDTLYDHVESVFKSFNAVYPNLITSWYVDIVENTGVITVATEDAAAKLTQFISKKTSKLPITVKIDSSRLVY